MTKVHVGAGSNIDRDANITGGIDEMGNRFGQLSISNIYESVPFGFDGENFYNLVVGFDTEFTLPELAVELREIEFQFGRKRNEQRFLSRTLDLDLLLFGDIIRHDDEYDLPREDILLYSFVLCPLAEIAGNSTHPESGQSFSDLWENFDKNKHIIWSVEFTT